MASFRKHGKHDDPLAGLTARALGHSTAPESACPDASALAAYFERSLSEAETAQHEQHFAACPRCQQQLATLARLNTAVPVSAADPTAVTELRGWRRHWNWRIWAPAAVALGALTLWIAGTTNVGLRARIDTPTQMAENRARELPAPAPQSPSTDELSRQNNAFRSGDSRAQNEAAAAGARRDENLAGGAKDSAEQSSRLSALKSQPAAPARESIEEFAVAPKSEKEQAAQTDALRDLKSDAEKKKVAETDSAPKVAAVAPPPPAAAPDQGQAAVAQTRSQSQLGALQGRQQAQATVTAEAAAPAENRAEQEQKLRRQRASDLQMSPGISGGFAADRAAMNQTAFTVHAPAPSLALWQIVPSGAIAKSTDSGRTWIAQKLPAPVEVTAGSAISDKICWLVGREGAVLRTTDGGAKWEKRASPAKIDLTGIEVRDAENATVTAADSRRFVTSNGGRTWKLLN